MWPPTCLNRKSYQGCPEKPMLRIRYNKHIKGTVLRLLCAPQFSDPFLLGFSKMKNKSCILRNYAHSCIHIWCSTYCLYFSHLFFKHFLSSQDHSFTHLALLETRVPRAIIKLASFFSFISVGSIQMSWSHHQLCDTLRSLRTGISIHTMYSWQLNYSA